MRCGNPVCSREGTSRCTGCGAISYCGRDCQRAHWKSHKPQCRAAGSPAPKSPGPGASGSALESQWRSALLQAQRNGNPLEVAQIQYNLSCMYLRAGQWAEALQQSQEAVAVCEKVLLQDATSASAKELSVLSLTSLCLALIESRQLAAAEEACERSLSSAETLFGLEHLHTVKALRVFAMLRERQQDPGECLALLRRALATATSLRAAQEVQEVTDELVKQLLQAGRVDEALEVGEEHFNSVSQASGSTDAALADALITHATVLGKTGRLDKAEQQARRAVELRERSSGGSSIPTAVALTVLAGILEDRGNVGAETEETLLKASGIFQRSEAHRQNAMMVIGQLQRIRARREEGEGGALMRRAGQCFESKDFRQAETLLSQALEMFVKEYGEQHPHTQAAAQNLSIARQNGILQLWREVVAEEAQLVRQGAEKGKSQRELDAELRLIGAQVEDGKGSCRIC